MRIYVYVCTCMYSMCVRIHVYISVSTFVCPYARVFIYLYVLASKLYVLAHSRLCSYVCVSGRMCVCACACMCIYMHVCMCICMYVCVYTCMYVCVCIRAYACVYRWTLHLGEGESHERCVWEAGVSGESLSSLLLRAIASSLSLPYCYCHSLPCARYII